MSTHVLHKHGNFIILDTGHDIIVKNTNGEYRNHAHFHRKTDKKGTVNLNAALLSIKLTEKKKIPKGRYMIGSVIRLSTDTEFVEDLKRIQAKRNSKERYFNSNKGTR